MRVNIQKHDMKHMSDDLCVYPLDSFKQSSAVNDISVCSHTTIVLLISLQGQKEFTISQITLNLGMTLDFTLG